jgi:CheY-like chemotaxis protein
VESHRHSVLVVEDEPDARDALVAYLQTVGHEAQGASEGADALRQLAAGVRPCTVVIDVAMPGMNGWDLLTAMRKDPALASLPVMMLTGSPEHAKQAVRFGVQTYFTKPTDPGGIAAAIARLCPQRQA